MTILCCVCLNPEATFSVCENNGQEVQFLSILRIIVNDVKWDETSLLCAKCVETLKIISRFINLCKQNNVINSKTEANDDYDDFHGTNDSGDDFNLKTEECEDAEIENLNLKCEYCEHKFECKTDLKGHLRTHSDIFICFHCERHFNSKTGLIKHIKNEHEENYFEEIKEESENSKKPWQCDRCFRSYTLQKTLSKHVLTCDGIRRHSKVNIASDRKNKCQKCLRLYTTDKILKAHLKTCDGNKTTIKSATICKICNETFDLVETRNEHIKNEHNIDITNENLCKYCFFQCNSEEEYKLHLQNNHLDSSQAPKPEKTPDKRRYTCEVCDLEFTHARKVVAHCASVHGIDAKKARPYACAHCFKRFISCNHLCEHEKYHHSNVRSHICSFCGKSFVTKSDLISHEYIHRNVRGYKCDQCSKDFNTNKNLRTHKLVVHTDASLWKYACAECNKRFPMKSSYDIHVKRHQGEKQFTCHICDKAFICRADIRRHMAAHTNIRQFKCQLCGKEYKNKAVFERHLKRSHDVGDAKIPERVRKHFCHICPKAFYDRNKLVRHMYTHSGLKPFSCTMCDKKFTDKSYVTQHMKLAHNVYKGDTEEKLLYSIL